MQVLPFSGPAGEKQFAAGAFYAADSDLELGCSKTGECMDRNVLLRLGLYLTDRLNTQG
jgi:hypothetical protein